MMNSGRDREPHLGMGSAKSLVEKLASGDKKFAEEFANAKSEKAFLDVAKKYGYKVSLEDFRDALETYKKSSQKSEGRAKGVNPAAISSNAVGLTVVGVDYAFVGVQTTHST